ncbi:hypothetical protein M501DRAFT_1037876 [Patellaria atrata CBS 101060]|uniref:Uncharacterized protein n=1 Tax=Patellaria atrata CBS 101060 TaxID=1346257 RepID=A0A9P4VPZ6_9PEZI|nr:hypothetical protein M501DRAFT_1037876 [Patellaria atrata CBS 101060]
MSSQTENLNDPATRGLGSMAIEGHLNLHKQEIKAYRNYNLQPPPGCTPSDQLCVHHEFERYGAELNHDMSLEAMRICVFRGVDSRTDWIEGRGVQDVHKIYYEALYKATYHPDIYTAREYFVLGVYTYGPDLNLLPTQEMTQHQRHNFQMRLNQLSRYKTMKFEWVEFVGFGSQDAQVGTMEELVQSMGSTRISHQLNPYTNFENAIFDVVRERLKAEMRETKRVLRRAKQGALEMEGDRMEIE